MPLMAWLAAAGFLEESCVLRFEEVEVEGWDSSASRRSISFLAFSMFYSHVSTHNASSRDSGRWQTQRKGPEQR